MNTPASKPWPFPTHDSMTKKVEDLGFSTAFPTHRFVVIAEARLDPEALIVAQQFSKLDERGRELAKLHLAAITKMCEGCKK